VKKTERKYLQPFSSGGCYVEGGMKKNRDFRPIYLYLENDTRYDRRRMRSIEWRHFQIPMTLDDPSPRFKGHAILRRRISKKRYKIET